ncbi:RICIN domain-containing protein [Actinomadura kijaniata]|uniref:RICIN domain-containing protein n=1 Tax=Actinomadura kijaniata TaxID=46161 RepID=UPI000834E514|nr:RICIN domain-containing protein [Actinomadura kijaniata]
MSNHMGFRHLALAAAATATLGVAAAGTCAAAAASTATTSAVAAKAGPGPFYWMINLKSGKAAMPYEHSKERRAPIIQSIKDGYGAQHWKILGSGTQRKLENRHSKYCMRAASTTSKVVEQDHCEFSGALWVVSDYDAMWAGKPVYWKNSYTGECLEGYGAVLRTASCTYTSNQYFRLEHVPGT